MINYSYMDYNRILLATNQNYAGIFAILFYDQIIKIITNVCSIIYWYLSQFYSYNSIELEGSRIINKYGYMRIYCGKEMYAISHYVQFKDRATSLKVQDSNFTNGLEFLLNQKYCSVEDYYIDVTVEIVKTPDCPPSEKIIFSIKSRKSTKEIIDFIEKCQTEYTEYLKNKNKNKLYHFIYTGTKEKTEERTFTSNLISDLSDENNQNYESFDCLFNDQKYKIMKDLDKLNDVNYYKKNGFKRKKGYLFHGVPGSGKTSSVMAMANYTKRHIVEIPLSRVKTNTEFEEIINKTSINNIPFKKNEIIILFDEFERSLEIIKNNEKPKDTSGENLAKLVSSLTDKKDGEPKDYDTSSDKLSLGTLLSRLDGIGSYNGLIIVATTNNVKLIDPVIYRDGRLDAVEFGYCKKNHMIEMIEKYYDIKLSQKQKENIPDEKHKIVPVTLKRYLEENDNFDDLLLLFENKYKKLIEIDDQYHQKN